VSGPVPDDLALPPIDDPSPPAPSERHRAEVARRSSRIVRRRRAVRGSAVVTLVVAVSLGVAIGAGRVGAPARHVTASPPSSTPSTAVPAPGTADQAAGRTGSPSSPATATANAGNSADTPRFGTVCPTAVGRPPSGPWTGCEPAAPRGDGHGPGGRCDGSEAAPPCGAGVVTGRAYAVTLPAGCATGVGFDGRRWTAVTDVPGAAGSTVDAWMRQVAAGRAESTGPGGTVEWLPDGATVPACRP